MLTTPLSPDVKNEYSHTSTPPMYLRGAGRANFTFLSTDEERWWVTRRGWILQSRKTIFPLLRIGPQTAVT